MKAVVVSRITFWIFIESLKCEFEIYIGQAYQSIEQKLLKIFNKNVSTKVFAAVEAFALFFDQTFHCRREIWRAATQDSPSNDPPKLESTANAESSRKQFLGNIILPGS